MKLVFWITLGASLGLIIGGFFAPPMGIIDGSVLTAVGELLAFASLGMLPELLKDHNARFTHGKTTLEITDGDD